MPLALDLLDEWHRLERLKAKKSVRLVIWHSPDGEKEWTPVLPADVPDWLRSPKVIGRLVDGDMVSDRMGLTGWYRGEKIEEAAEQPQDASDMTAEAKQ